MSMNTVPKSSGDRGSVTLAMSRSLISEVHSHFVDHEQDFRRFVACKGQVAEMFAHQVVQQFTRDDEHQQIGLVYRLIGRFVMVCITGMDAGGIEELNPFPIVPRHRIGTDVGINGDVPLPRQRADDRRFAGIILYWPTNATLRAGPPSPDVTDGRMRSMSGIIVPSSNV